MVTLVGISGSLRKGSYNTALLRAALSLAPEGVTFARRRLPASRSTMPTRSAAAFRNRQ